MKQLLQDLSKGYTTIIEAPSPVASTGTLLINSSVSLISAGTERMLVDFGRAGYLQKARQQPEKVKMVLEKAKTDGIITTYEAVRAKLAQPLPLGYSNVGIVAEVGRGLEGFKPGDRVVSNGRHAEVVRVPQNLCAKIPDSVSDEQAVFTVLGAIALQGIRLAGPTLGETFAVTGTGLIGLLVVQLLKANGCRVLAIDFDDRKLARARQYGAETCNPGKGEDPVAAGLAFSRGKGVDGVIIAAATKSNDPVTQAARLSRKRGRIILVGVTGLELNRADFYEKELTFQVSCSYGPGRYDPEYEDKGHDYPFGYVRWTEQRNFEAVLDMMAEGRLDVAPLITHRFAFEDAPKAYVLLSQDKEPYLGILLEYGQRHEGGKIGKVEGDDLRTFEPSNLSTEKQRTVALRAEVEEKQTAPGKPVVSFIGAGNYASRVLIPAFKEAGGQLHTLVTSGGVSGAVHGKKAGFAYASTDIEAMLGNNEINTVVIATRHDTHARFVLRALEAGKHVFVEKPLCLTMAELEEIRSRMSEVGCRTSDVGPPVLMVGFNRRFSPQILKIKTLLEAVRAPKSLVMTVNAGEIPGDHWTQDPEIGGGRVIGEACHFIDLLRFLAGCPIVSHSRAAMNSENRDTLSIQLEFADGSIGTVHYFANGSKAFPKERLEVFAAGRILQLDNFRKLRGFGWPGFRKMNLWRQDKGQKTCVAAFLEAVKQGGPEPIAMEEIFEVAKVSIKVAQII
jgi:predicted dehydrogenase/threonine dehydrogenase-like Zn-dependent dehydrogenase